MIYIASPYSHMKQEVMDKRHDAVRSYTAFLLRAGVIAYSPIVHCHDLAKHEQLPTTWEFWQWYNIGMLRFAQGLYVLCIDGWRESRGVEFELFVANQLNITIKMIKDDEWRESSTPVNSPKQQS